MLSLIQEASEQRWKEGDRVRYRPLLVLTASVCTRVSSTAASSMLVSETARENEKGRCTGQGVEGGHRRDGLQCICCCAEKLHCCSGDVRHRDRSITGIWSRDSFKEPFTNWRVVQWKHTATSLQTCVFFNITDTTILLYFYFIYILKSYVYMYIICIYFNFNILVVLLHFCHFYFVCIYIFFYFFIFIFYLCDRKT